MNCPMANARWTKSQSSSLISSGIIVEGETIFESENTETLILVSFLHKRAPNNLVFS